MMISLGYKPKAIHTIKVSGSSDKIDKLDLNISHINKILLVDATSSHSIYDEISKVQELIFQLADKNCKETKGEHKLVVTNSQELNPFKLTTNAPENSESVMIIDAHKHRFKGKNQSEITIKLYITSNAVAKYSTMRRIHNLTKDSTVEVLLPNVEAYQFSDKGSFTIYQHGNNYFRIATPETKPVKAVLVAGQYVVPEIGKVEVIDNSNGLKSKNVVVLFNGITPIGRNTFNWGLNKNNTDVVVFRSTDSEYITLYTSGDIVYGEYIAIIDDIKTKGNKPKVTTVTFNKMGIFNNKGEKVEEMKFLELNNKKYYRFKHFLVE